MTSPAVVPRRVLVPPGSLSSSFTADAPAPRQPRHGWRGRSCEGRGAVAQPARLGRPLGR